MRRSEAWNKFYELACDAEEDDWLDNPMCVAENFLKLAEDIGMAPPFYDKIQNNNGNEVVIPAREWEPEDEA